MKNISIGQSILSMPDHSSQKVALRFVENKQWIDWNWKKYHSEIYKVASCLIENQIKAGDKVAICSATRISWALIDLATLSLHGITIPIYPNNTAEEIEFILNNSQAKILFLETKNHLKIWSQIAKKCPQVKKVLRTQAK